MIKEAVRVQPIKKDFIDVLWDFLSSIRMAIWLLSISAVAILVGTVVEQGQPIEKYMATYGPTLTKIMETLQVFDLYKSWWFEVLMSLICLNLILSNFNRAEKVVKKYHRPPIRMEASYFRDTPAPAVGQFRGTLREACLKLENAFFRLKYKFMKEEAGDSVYYYADFGRLAMWGSFVAHIGLLLLFAGVVYGHFPGQSFERTTNLLEGGSYYIPESKFAIRLKKFEAQWDEQRRPRLYRSTLEVVPDKGTPFTQAIEVNRPLNYRGVKVYQATYGPGRIYGHYADKKGKRHEFAVTYNDAQMMFFPVDPGNGGQWVGVLEHFVPDFAVTQDGQVASMTDVPVNPGFFVRVVTRVDKMPPDPKTIKQVGWVTRDQTAAFNGVTVHLDKVDLFSGFQLRRDPGVPFIYLAFIVILVGVCLTFYVPHKVIRAWVSRAGDTIQAVLVGARRDKEQEYGKEHEFILRTLQGG